eukprot:28593_1
MVSSKLKILVVLATLLITAFDVSGKRGRSNDHQKRPRKRPKFNYQPTDRDNLDHPSNSHSNSTNARNTNVLNPRVSNLHQSSTAFPPQINDYYSPIANAVPNGSNHPFQVQPNINRSDTNNGYGQQPTATQQTQNVNHPTSTGDNYDTVISQKIVETIRSITQSMIDESYRDVSAYHSDCTQIMKPNIYTNRDPSNSLTMLNKRLEEIKERDEKYVAMLKNKYDKRPLLNQMIEMLENGQDQDDMSQQYPPDVSSQYPHNVSQQQKHNMSHQYPPDVNQHVQTNAYHHVQTTASMSASPSPGSYNQQYTVNQHVILMSTLERSPPTLKLQNVNCRFKATTSSTGKTSIPVTVNIQEPEKKNTQNTDWTCSTCTFENSFIVQICEICGMKKSQLPSQAS